MMDVSVFVSLYRMISRNWYFVSIYGSELNLLKEKYTQFHVTVKMKDKPITRMREAEFLEYVINNRNSDVYIWYLVASWACKVTVILPQ